MISGHAHPISLIMNLRRAMASPTSTFTLLEKAKAGDEPALSRAFEKVRRRLAVLIHFKLRPRSSDFSEVEDVVQETYLRAFRDLDRFSYQSPGSFLRWLSSIADHVIVDRIRYRSRARRAGDEVPLYRPIRRDGIH
jgi:DNA-directed RNA polymerase specialized sigma24 family protein